MRDAFWLDSVHKILWVLERWENLSFFSSHKHHTKVITQIEGDRETYLLLYLTNIYWWINRQNEEDDDEEETKCFWGLRLIYNVNNSAPRQKNGSFHTHPPPSLVKCLSQYLMDVLMSSIFFAISVILIYRIEKI